VATYAYYVNINHTAYSYMVNIGPSALIANAFTNGAHWSYRLKPTLHL